jgi:acyl-CoA synthetase (AMP-forming)/AMP-acid ligase II
VTDLTPEQKADEEAAWDDDLRPRWRLDEVLAESIRRHPDREALVDDVERVTFAELERRVDRLASALRETGIEPGDCVAVAISTGCIAAVTLYAISRAGATAVPLNEFWTAPEIADALCRSGARHLVHDARLGAPSAPAAGALELLDETQRPARILVRSDGWVQRVGGTPSRRGREDTDVALVLFTSGSTASPKGARVTHEGLVGVAHYFRLAQQLTAEDRFLHLMPLYHVGGIVNGVLPIHLAGGTCVMTRFNPDHILRLFEDERITATAAFDSMHEAIRRADDYRPERHAHWRVASISGSPEMYRQLSTAGVAQVVAGLGMTETSGDVSYVRPWQDEEARQTTLGLALPGVDLRIVAPDSGAEAAAGAVGELRVRGWSLFRGYIDGTDGCDERGFFMTGDLARLRSDGALEFHGRLKHMIKSGGENVSAFEVESYLTSLPEIKSAVVVGVPDERWGEMVVAFVEPAGSPIDVDALKARCKEQLAGYKIPKRFLPLTGNGWPLMAAGKIDRAALAQLAVERANETPVS